MLRSLNLFDPICTHLSSSHSAFLLQITWTRKEEGLLSVYIREWSIAVLISPFVSVVSEGEIGGWRWDLSIQLKWCMYTICWHQWLQLSTTTPVVRQTVNWLHCRLSFSPHVIIHKRSWRTTFFGKPSSGCQGHNQSVVASSWLHELAIHSCVYIVSLPVATFIFYT